MFIESLKTRAKTLIDELRTTPKKDDHGYIIEAHTERRFNAILRGLGLGQRSYTLSKYSPDIEGFQDFLYKGPHRNSLEAIHAYERSLQNNDNKLDS